MFTVKQNRILNVATRLILSGRVQGVACRHYCSRYGRHLGLQGAASNLRDGTVEVLLNTDDRSIISSYINAVTVNTLGLTFFGHISDIETEAYQGSLGGDYEF